MKKIHPTQQRLLSFLKNRDGSVKNLSLRDIGEKIGVGRRAQVVLHHLNQLEKKGIIREDSSQERKYILLDEPILAVTYINLYSCTAECGPNGFLGSDTILERIPLPTRTFGITNPDDFFLIKARGDSMEPMIKEGDLVLAKVQQEIPSNGSIAVVVHNGMPKIKIISEENINGQRAYCLESLNSNKFPREFIDDEAEGLRIVGIVKNIISKPKID